MYRTQVVRIQGIHILILIILQIRRRYTVSMRSNHKMVVVQMGGVNVVQI